MLPSEVKNAIFELSALPKVADRILVVVGLALNWLRKVSCFEMGVPSEALARMKY
jgi:hypothetical protein